MFLKEIDSNLRHKTKIIPKFVGLILVLQFMTVFTANAVEVLTAKELTSHCKLLSSEPEGIDGQYCIRYIQGFIDGAIATDARVMLNAENAISKSETFSERAMRTRMPGRSDLSRAAKLAGFCLGDPLPIREVVNLVVKDLNAHTKEEPAMEVVYNSLIKNYPCR